MDVLAHARSTTISLLDTLPSLLPASLPLVVARSLECLLEHRHALAKLCDEKVCPIDPEEERSPPPT